MAPVVHEMGGELLFDDLDFRWVKGTLNRLRLAIPTGLLGLYHDLGHMIGVLRPDNRLPVFLNALDEMAQAVRPGPVGIRFTKDLPGTDVIQPHLIAAWGPIIAHHLNGALCAV